MDRILFLLYPLIISGIWRWLKFKSSKNLKFYFRAFLRDVLTFAVFYVIIFILVVVFLGGQVGFYGPKDDFDLTEELVKGRIEYYILDSMVVGKDYPAIATISKSFNDSTLFEFPPNVLISTGSVSAYSQDTIQVASRMKLVLQDPIGTNFFINPLSSSEQHVDEFTTTSWNWIVKPLKSGRLRLLLTATYIVYDSDGRLSKDVAVFERDFYVESSIKYTVEELLKRNWLGLLPIVFLPIIYKLFNAVKNKLKRKPPQIGFKSNVNKEDVE